MYAANPCSSPAVTQAMLDGRLLFIDTPAQGNRRPPGVTWMADNGCFSDKWDEPKWWAFLERNAHAAADCLFAVAPDVVGDAGATLEKSRPWFSRIRHLGYPVAFVAQDGFEGIDVPWDSFEVLFIGGTDEFKLGPSGREAAHQAKLRGKKVHVGRVNSHRRFIYAASAYPYGLGADTADGTFLTRGPDVNLPKLLGWTRSLQGPALIGGAW